LSRMFQSSPAPKSGCNRRRSRIRSILYGFNPHPLRRADAICYVVGFYIYCTCVSILTRSEERMQSNLARLTLRVSMFQSSPAPKSGCNLQLIHQSPLLTLFQSSPAPKSGCNMQHPRGATTP